MNQHASRPVAQGFPLHRRMNGPIQNSGGGGSGPNRSTQLRPSNPSVTMTNGGGGALRRSLGCFNSQIPIRIGFGNHSQQASLRARVLERHRQSIINSSTSQTSSVPQTMSMRTSAPGSASTSQQQQQQPPIDSAFKRLQTDFRDFHAMCSRLILKEKEEKEKWHTLCLKMMKERDTARQRINVLVSERETHLSSSSSPSSSSSAVVVPASSFAQASKRGRDESTTGSAAAAAVAAQEQSPSRSSPVESRPIRGLRLSPFSSPSRSPSAASLRAIDSSTLQSASSESPPPLPSSSNPGKAVPTSTSSTSTLPPYLDSSSSSSSTPPLNIMTFNPARSPDDQTCFDVFGEFDIPESRPVKRRKSYDPSSSSDNDEVLPFLIAHTDIMYMPMKGRLYCRACLLDKTTNPSNNNRIPKTFPTNVNWNELRDHCVCEHFTACQDVARLSPDDLNELRRRLYK